MSKFVEKLQRLSRDMETPLGFRTISSTPKSPPMLLIASLSQANTKIAKKVAESGVDAVFVADKGLTSENLKGFLAIFGDIPVGVSLEASDPKAVPEFISSGCDFLVFGLKAPLAIMQGEGVGKILEIKPSLEPRLVRAISRLEIPVDGVLISGEVAEPGITVECLLVYYHLAELLDKPILVTLPLPVVVSELQSLREAGVSGIVIPAEVNNPTPTFKELKRGISSLKRVKKRSGKLSPVLPYPAGELAAESGEEEEI